MKKLNHLLRKCKSLRQLGRSSSYSSLRSKSSRMARWSQEDDGHDERRGHIENGETIYVGKTRRRYVIDSKYLTHPLLNALIEKSGQKSPGAGNMISIKCEVVLFDHLLWMLENGDPSNLESESLDELAELYVSCWPVRLAAHLLPPPGFDPRGKFYFVQEFVGGFIFLGFMFEFGHPLPGLLRPARNPEIGT
ncbi:hypothetical protein Cgig2_021411 [Carnegiea gigantea]|uniref:Small auxin up regulated protein n=1 Tax=Carnegiea gigantea TaxID=171969 RepID=A0A9Q1GWB2_9CARY|nr:hypothetical protein Cgig2_021411 [Carnegiea gigantea]